MTDVENKPKLTNAQDLITFMVKMTKILGNLIRELAGLEEELGVSLSDLQSLNKPDKMADLADSEIHDLGLMFKLFAEFSRMKDDLDNYTSFSIEKKRELADRLMNVSNKYEKMMKEG